MQQLTLEPIGIVRTGALAPAEAARQPAAAGDTAGTIHLYPGRHFEHALEDLAGWDYLWVIFWFHRNQTWRPKVLPPRSTGGRKGVFATRSPHRPNPLGLSAVRLDRVDGLTLHVRELDMLDGTPVLDLKPYVPYTDARPAARSGWLEGAGGPGPVPADPVPEWTVAFDARPAEQAAWIQQQTGLPLADRIRAALALGPHPRAYRRIRRDGDTLVLAVKEWRVRFAEEGRTLRVLAISSGYRPAEFAAAETGPLAVHRAFSAAWR